MEFHTGSRTKNFYPSDSFHSGGSEDLQHLKLSIRERSASVAESQCGPDSSGETVCLTSMQFLELYDD